MKSIRTSIVCVLVLTLLVSCLAACSPSATSPKDGKTQTTVNHSATTTTQPVLVMQRPSAEDPLTEEEAAFTYPDGINPAFKKLYYQNNDFCGWLTCDATDGSDIHISAPIVQTTDTSFYASHDFNKNENSNGTLFVDPKNTINPASYNHNTIVYGQNAPNGYLHDLNYLLQGVHYARVMPTFTLDTLYDKAEYKIFAVLLINNTDAYSLPYDYLQTSFSDDYAFAEFLNEMSARSLYTYGDVDLSLDDTLVMLSTYTKTDLVQYTPGRPVVIGRRVREGEDPATDVSQIRDNKDVLMPYAWYISQQVTPHPYYTDPEYTLPPANGLEDYFGYDDEDNVYSPTPTTTTVFTLSPPTDPTDFADVPTTEITTSTTVYTTTTVPPTQTNPPTTQTEAPTVPPTAPPTTQTTMPFMATIAVESTPVNYAVGSHFDYANTVVVGVYSDGTRVPIDATHCGITGFDSSVPGVCHLTVNYGTLSVDFSVNIIG